MTLLGLLVTGESGGQARGWRNPAPRRFLGRRGAGRDYSPSCAGRPASTETGTPGSVERGGATCRLVVFSGRPCGQRPGSPRTADAGAAGSCSQAGTIGHGHLRRRLATSSTTIIVATGTKDYSSHYPSALKSRVHRTH
jgi:hypothetical protein